MIDSHCHLDHEPLLSEINEIIKRAKKVGVEKLLTISTTFNSFKRILVQIQFLVKQAYNSMVRVKS